MILYDVCNDYTLDDDVSLARREKAATKEYKWMEGRWCGEKLTLGVHKGYNEIHYAKSINPNLNGKRI